jgi:hypothetical protein
MALTKASYSLISGAPYNVNDYGAVGNGVADDTAAINAAISAANTAGGGVVYIPQGTYLIGAYAYTGVLDGVSGILLRDNVQLVIDGTVKVKNNATGAGTFYGAIRSPDIGISNASITGVGTIDGNRANQTPSINGQCSNIYLTCVFNVVVDGIYSVNANGMGIQLIPPSSLPNPPVGGATTHTACAVQNCFVNNVLNIGIQVSHGLFGNISENRITTCVNNCIDIYGDDGPGNPPDNGIMSINGNTVGGGLVGVFIETSKRISVVGNSVDGCTIGIAINRIDGAPAVISISGNTVSGCATGISNTGDTGGILISNNFIAFTSFGLVLGGTTVALAGNVSYTNAFGNVFSPGSSTAPIIIVGGYQASFNIVRENYYVATSTALYSNVASINVNNTIELPKFDQAIQPIKRVYGGTSTSGGTATLTLPSDSGGKLVIKSSAGGSNYSVWSGSFVSSGTGAAVNQDSTTFVAGSNNIASVTASSANFTVTITFAATGSGGIWNAWAEYY